MSRKGWLLFAAMCLIWGIPYLLIRVAVRDVSPAMLVFARCALGGLLLLPIALRSGGLRPLLPYWRPILAFVIVEYTVPWWMLSHAETKLSSSLAGLLVAAVPLVSIVLVRFSGESGRVGPVRVAGLLLGLAGVGLLLGLDVSHVSLLPVLEIGLVAIGYAVGPMIQQRWLSTLPIFPVVSVCLISVAVIYLPVALIQWPSHVDSGPLASIVVLGIVCTAVASVVFFALIGEVGSSRAVVITYVNPAVAVLLGVVFLSEPFTVGIAVGFPLILLGSILATRASPPGKSDPPAPARVIDDDGAAEPPVPTELRPA